MQVQEASLWALFTLVTLDTDAHGECVAMTANFSLGS